MFPCSIKGHNEFYIKNPTKCFKCHRNKQAKEYRKRKKVEFHNKFENVKKQKIDLENKLEKKDQESEEQKQALEILNNQILNLKKADEEKDQVIKILNESIENKEKQKLIFKELITNIEKDLDNLSKYTMHHSLFNVIAKRANITKEWFDLTAVPQNKKLKIIGKNSLEYSWDNIKAFINPPFKQKISQTFMMHALSAKGSIFIFILPNTCNKWFVDIYKKNYTRMKVNHIWGRVKFGKFTDGYRYPIMIVEIHSEDINIDYSDFSNIFTSDIEDDPYCGYVTENFNFL